MKEFKKKKRWSDIIRKRKFVKGIRDKIEKKNEEKERYYIINKMMLNYRFYVLKFKIYYLKFYNY